MAADTDSALYSWSATESNNKPTGTTTVGTNWDDNLRMIQKVVRGWLATKGADIASAGTTDLGAIEGYAHDITGTTTITGFGTVSAGIPKVIKFEGALTLTHNATSLILPGGENITTADGDVAFVISEGSGNWRCISYVRAAVSPNSGFSTGDVKLTIKTTADAGWVLMNDTTIGDATSGATGRANADTVALYTLLWNNTVNGDCAVSSGRGANAAADYAAHKTIALPKALGRALATYGTGSGLTARTLAKATGSEDSINVAHVHTVTDAGHVHGRGESTNQNLIGGASGAFVRTNVQAASNTDSATTGISIDSSGSSGTGANMPPTLFLNTMIKL